METISRAIDNGRSRKHIKQLLLFGEVELMETNFVLSENGINVRCFSSEKSN
jgi:hypothetical protein